MEELNSDGLGYIEPYMLKLLLEGSASLSHTLGNSAPRASRDNHHETMEVTDDSATMIARTREHAIIRNASSQVEQFWQELRRLGIISNHLGKEHIDRSKLGTAHALKVFESMSRTTWPVVEKLFNELSPNGLLHRSKFGLCIGITEQDYADNLFGALARRCNIGADYINKAELLELWDQISDQRFDSRLQIFTDMMENSPDGRITEDDVKEIFILRLLGKELSGIQNNIEQEAHGKEMSEIPKISKEYAHVIMEDLDPNNLGYIEAYNLQMKVMQARRQSLDLDISTANNGDLGQMNRRLLQTMDRGWYQRARYLLKDNWKGVRVMLLWLCICVGLFAWKFTQYRRRRAVFRVMGYCICVAKGGAETLKFNMALILLPVCRNTITWLRSWTKISNSVPLDDSIIFHKMIAVGIIIGAGLHVIPYMTCGIPRLLHLTDEDYKPMQIFFGEKRPANYWGFLMGTEGGTGMILLVLMAVAFTLATDSFRRLLPSLLRWLAGYNSFWYSHHLFIIVYALLIVHGNGLYLTRKWYSKTTWFYLSVPMVLYACERFTRALRSRMRPAKILKVTIYPGNVTRLQFTKPLGFKYKSGQYIYVKCAAVSALEWHPFYVTSAPLDDYISIHIRTFGDWTRKLKTIFSEVCRPPKEGDSGLLRAEYHSDGSRSNPRFPKMLIDGPYSAPAQDYERYDIVLLIGLGIGFTPFISIMKDISNNSKQLDDIESGAVGRAAKSSFQTRRAYIHWIAREQGSWDWFKSMVEEVVETDRKGVIELHTYCTSVYAEGDARSALIGTLTALNQAKDGVDAVSGSRVKTHFGRPNFRNVYRHVALNHRNQRVGVFYCGAPVISQTLRELANDFSRKTSTKFEFHYEGF